MLNYGSFPFAEIEVVTLNKRKAAPPRWKRRPCSLVCASFNPVVSEAESVMREAVKPETVI
mgnify:CR=1 FL=1